MQKPPLQGEILSLELENARKNIICAAFILPL